MSVLLATLCLNEMEWLPHLYAQHRDWPELDSWVFVEAADRAYAAVNPHMVSAAGLSTDGTTEYLQTLASRDHRVQYIPHGFSANEDSAKGKIEARQRYMEIASQVRPDFVIVLDADEFYTRRDQAALLKWMRRYSEHDGFIFPKREIWRPPSIANLKLFGYEVVDGFWGIACCHWWRWSEGVHYGDCHNTPSYANGRPLNDRMIDLRDHFRPVHLPQLIHLGYAANKRCRLAKNAYYAHRGEAVDPKRSWYVRSRSAWSTWRPGSKLPDDARVIDYTGPVPEIFEAPL